MISTLPMNTAVAHTSEKMIRRLASALCCAYNIPQGDQFVMFIGHGEEANNHHAVESWVESTLSDLDESTAKAILPHLVERFGQELQQWESLAW